MNGNFSIAFKKAESRKRFRGSGSRLISHSVKLMDGPLADGDLIHVQASCVEGLSYCGRKDKGVWIYRDEIYSLQNLLSRTQAGPGRTVKKEQEEISPNHVQRLNLISDQNVSAIRRKIISQKDVMMTIRFI